MQCSQCGFENRPDARFCKQCGTLLSTESAIDVTCPACGAALRPGARFCRQCGRPLAGPASLPTAITLAPPPLPATPPPVPPLIPPPGGPLGVIQTVRGNQNLQLSIGEMHGGVVTISAPVALPQPRPQPVTLLPAALAEWVDRESEVCTVTEALQKQPAVDLYGPAGAGKTTLLRILARQEPALVTAFPAGIVYHSAQGEGVEELLLALYDLFYERPPTFKPSEAQIQQALREVRALILLDDVKLPRGELDKLRNAAPACTFFLVTVERCLWGEGETLGLAGLPAAEALLLIERALGRSLTPEECPIASELCDILEGRPLHLLQAVALVEESGYPWSEVVQRLKTRAPELSLIAQLLATLPEPELRVLAVLAAVDGAPFPEQHLAPLTGLSEVQPVLASLIRRGLVQAHSPRYTLTGALAQALHQAWDLTGWIERALVYFSGWAEAQRAAPRRLEETADTILGLLGWAVQTQRWDAVLRLGRAIEPTLVLSGRWEAWGRLLHWLQQAAQALGEAGAEAWVLHQMGTRALCAGDAATAQATLSQALQLRLAARDRAGAEVTRHNLELLLGPGASRKPPVTGPIQPAAATGGGLTGVIKVLIAVAAVVTLVVGGGFLALAQKATIRVHNEGCSELVPPPGLNALPGVQLFERLPPGAVDTMTVPALLLGQAELTVAESSAAETTLRLMVLGQAFDFPVTGEVVDVTWDGESVLKGRVALTSSAKHDLVITCRQ